VLVQRRAQTLNEDSRSIEIEGTDRLAGLERAPGRGIAVVPRHDVRVQVWHEIARELKVELDRLEDRLDGARAAGGGPLHILLRHIRPNILGSLAVVASVEIANVILLESSLGFLGLGVQPPTPSWGNMLGEGRDYLTTAWWLATLPGLALATTALSITLVGDFLRDFFDPRWLSR
jgi:peptide/nickel transport system permease protein